MGNAEESSVEAIKRILKDDREEEENGLELMAPVIEPSGDEGSDGEIVVGGIEGLGMGLMGDDDEEFVLPEVL